MYYKCKKTGLIVRAVASQCSSKILCTSEDKRQFELETKAFANKFDLLPKDEQSFTAIATPADVPGPEVKEETKEVVAEAPRRGRKTGESVDA